MMAAVVIWRELLLGDVPLMGRATVEATIQAHNVLLASQVIYLTHIRTARVETAESLTGQTGVTGAPHVESLLASEIARKRLKQSQVQQHARQHRRRSLTTVSMLVLWL